MGREDVPGIVIDVDGLDHLLRVLKERGMRVVGPTVVGEAIVYDEIDTVRDLPAGVTDEQDGGHYRLRSRDDGALFGYAVGPHSWKRFLFPPRTVLWRAERSDGVFRLIEEPDAGHRSHAFFGVRACELHAMAIQDRVFLDCDEPDRTYRRGRGSAFLVAVNCGTPAGTCFCTSMDAGPRVSGGEDLALTELLDGERHEFVIEAGSDAGRDVLSELSGRTAEPTDHDAVDAVVEAAASVMGRTLDTHGIREVLADNLEHPRWDDVAQRCLACTNCTLVCPTCFCSTVEDSTDVTGTEATRERRWDSCFTMDFSYVHGGAVRSTTRSRYRQWMTHKLGTWIDQFGSSGCVGCGRCITWCPVGIDITEEMAAIRAAPLSDARRYST